MTDLLKILPLALYFLVGFISLVMVFKSFSNKYLPFHEQAAGRPWKEIDDRLKLVILFLLRLGGLGFMIIAILLLVFPAITYFFPNKIFQLSIPFIALIYCTGLFANNYWLYKKTKANTPWKGSLYAIGILLAGIGVSILVGK
jgi:hypothetical protein